MFQISLTHLLSLLLAFNITIGVSSISITNYAVVDRNKPHFRSATDIASVEMGFSIDASILEHVIISLTNLAQL